MSKKKQPVRARPGRPRGATRTTRARVVASGGGVVVSEVAELDALRRELERTARAAAPTRWNADPEEVQRSVAHLVLTLIEFVRALARAAGDPAHGGRHIERARRPKTSAVP